MIPKKTDSLSTLRRTKPAAMPPALREHLLDAMRAAVAQENENTALCAAYQPTPLSSHQKKRFLRAMQTVRGASRRRYHIWWGSSAAAAVLLLGFFLWWPQQESVAALPGVAQEPRVTMQRQVLGAGGSAHCDTFTMEDQDSSCLVIRVTSNAPLLLPDEVI